MVSMEMSADRVEVDLKLEGWSRYSNDQHSLPSLPGLLRPLPACPEELRLSYEKLSPLCYCKVP